MPILICPTCADKFHSEKTDAMPFCCQRCRLIDLGRWLDERHGLPVDAEADVDAMAADREDES